MKYIFLIITLIGVGAGGYLFRDEITDAINNLSNPEDVPTITNENFGKIVFSLKEGGYSLVSDFEEIHELRLDEIPEAIDKNDVGYLEFFRDVEYDPSHSAVEHVYRRFSRNLLFSGGSFRILNDTIGRNILNETPVFEEYFLGSINKKNNVFVDEISIQDRVVFLTPSDKYVKFENFETTEKTYELIFEYDFERAVGTFAPINVSNTTRTVYLPPTAGQTLNFRKNPNYSFLIDQKNNEFLETYSASFAGAVVAENYLSEPTYTVEKMYRLDSEPLFLKVEVVLGNFTHRFARRVRFETGENNTLSTNIVTFFVKFGDVVESYETHTPEQKRISPLTSQIASSSISGNSVKDITGRALSNMVGGNTHDADWFDGDYTEIIMASLISFRDSNFMTYNYNPHYMSWEQTGLTVYDLLSNKSDDLGFRSFRPIDSQSLGTRYDNLGGDGQHLNIFRDVHHNWRDIVEMNTRSNAFIYSVKPGHPTSSHTYTVVKPVDNGDPIGYKTLSTDFDSRYFGPNTTGVINANTGVVHVIKPITRSMDEYPVGAVGDLGYVWGFRINGDVVSINNNPSSFEELELVRNVSLNEEVSLFEEMSGFVLKSHETTVFSEQDYHTFSITKINDENKIIPKNVLGVDLTLPLSLENPFESLSGYLNITLVEEKQGQGVFKIYEVDISEELIPKDEYLSFDVVSGFEPKHGDSFIDENGELYKLHRERSGVQHVPIVYIDGVSIKVNNHGVSKLRVKITEYQWDEYTTEETTYFDTNAFPDGFILNEERGMRKGDRERIFYYSIPR